MYQIKIGEQSFEVVPEKGHSDRGTVGGSNYQLDIAGESEDFNVLYENGSYNVTVVEADYKSRTFTLRVNSNEYTLEAKDRFDLLLEELGMEDIGASGVNDLKAPMPGMVLKINVEAGQEVKKGDLLLVLEAMKMENNLKAETDATVKAIHAQAGKAVDKNQVLIEFEA